MKTRTTITSSIAALTLSAALMAPALAAAPTFSGPSTCERASDGETVEMVAFEGATKRSIAATKKLWTVQTGYCKNGTYDTSALTKDA